MSESQAPEDIFASIARNYAGRPDIQLGTGFGDGPALRASGELFAALSDGALVVRLPPPRCAMLVDAGEGRLMTEDGQTLEDWFVVDSDDAAEWLAFVTEAAGAARG